jgi:phosphoribosylanthranilate isomerase
MTWIKICGTTSVQDAQISIASGADALGFIFAPSPRRIDIPRAFDIISTVPKRIDTIGVFVNETPRHVGEVVSQVAFTGVQLHGDEAPEHMKEYRRVLGGRQIIKTLQARELLSDGEEKLERYLAEWDSIDTILLDSGSAEERGGTGVPFAWEELLPLAAKIKEAMPLIIAGGLNPENVGKALELFEPWGVDVVSSVEEEPGKKDEGKLKHFVTVVRGAQAAGQH